MTAEEREEKTEKFLFLRGIEGKSFDQISEEIEVSKPTLITWSIKNRADLENLKSSKYEQLMTELKITHYDRVKKYGEFYNRLMEKLEKVDLDKVHPDRLLQMVLSLESKLFFDITYKDTFWADIDQEYKETSKFY